MTVPLSKPSIGEAEIAAAVRVLQSGWMTHGPVGRELETEFACFIGVEHAVTLNSATAALHLAVQLLPCRGEVLLPSFTFVASANAVVAAGCRPVFVDVDPHTGCMDPAAIHAGVTTATVAVMPVHFAGGCCDMRAICAAANCYGLAVIEDSAEAVGATFAGGMTGSFGTGCFSFFPTKNIACGEGGMLTTNDAELARSVRTLRAHGIDPSVPHPAGRAWYRSAEQPGYNFRLSDVLAAVALEQLRRLPEMNERRREHAAHYEEALQCAGVEVMPAVPGATHVYQMFTVRVDARRFDRDAVVQSLNRRGISASVHFDPPVHRQQPYAECRQVGELSGTDELSATVLSLPMYPDLTPADRTAVINAFHAALDEARR